jgi:hypothetical protein
MLPEEDSHEPVSPAMAAQTRRSSQASELHLDTKTTRLSAVTSEPLEDYREPEPVPDYPMNELEYPNPNQDWGRGASPTWFDQVANPVVHADPDSVPHDWWNAKYRTPTPERPGPGALASIVEGNVMVDTLFEVTVTGVPRRPDTTPDSFVPPTLDQARECAPPKMYYSKTSNGWVYLDYSAGNTTLPPMIPNRQHRPYPSQAIRSRRKDCLASEPVESTWLAGASATKTHHYHIYERAIDPCTISDIPLDTFLPSQLQFHAPEVTHVEGDNKENFMETDTPSPPTQGTTERYALDIYVCALCQMYLLASPVFPGIIPTDVVDAFVTDRLSNPPPGQTPAISVALAWELILRFVASLRSHVSCGTKFHPLSLELWSSAYFVAAHLLSTLKVILS